jgi:flavin-dependent dehydrogenase
VAETAEIHDDYILDDGANIGVIGGGPTGSFFAIFAMKMAKMIGKQINITIFEPKNFTKDGPMGCNRCGGIISELLVQTLAVEGINLPDSVVRKGINSYNLHTNHGDVFIATPDLERTIATVYRGGGPKGMSSDGKESFDNFLLKEAIREGAAHNPARIDRIEMRNKKPVLFSKDAEISEFDLVVGAFGVNSTTANNLEEIGFGYKEPPTVTTAIAELNLGQEMVAEYFGSSVHLFLLPDKGMKFAAMVPKGSYVTLCILGKEMNANSVNDFLARPVVKGVLKSVPYSVECRCLPKMNVGAPEIPFTDRVVMCGDAGSTRLFKDGLGAAYLMGKAVAKTAVFQGVSKQHFHEDYLPVYKSLVTDNLYGRFLFAVTDIFRKNRTLTKGMLGVVRKEQRSSSRRILSTILWNMFTGNERYKNVFPKSLDVRMHANLLTEFAKILIGRA